MPADMTTHRTDGFTLIELVIVMIIVSVGVLGLVLAFSNASKSLSINETLQQAAQYAQECGESAMVTRRNQGFAWFATNTFSCNNPSNFTRTVSVNTYTGPASGACNGNNPCPCPSGVACRDIAIEARSTLNTSIYSSIVVMLVNY